MSLQAVVPNGPAKKAGVHNTLYEAGEASGEPFEISTLRREVRCLHVILLKTFSYTYHVKVLEVYNSYSYSL